MGLQIDILVVNCSVFNPTPSLSAAVVNQFRLKSKIITYNLSGMGCSAGLLSVALVRELLQVSPVKAMNSVCPVLQAIMCPLHSYCYASVYPTLTLSITMRVIFALCRSQ